jgi:hypothetical protein
MDNLRLETTADYFYTLPIITPIPVKFESNLERARPGLPLTANHGCNQ